MAVNQRRRETSPPMRWRSTAKSVLAACARRTRVGVLWRGIASAGRAERVAQTLFAPESFSGWGVRTIAEARSRYNPMSYPAALSGRTTTLIGKGLARYGMKDRAMAIPRSDVRCQPLWICIALPELFCGFIAPDERGGRRFDRLLAAGLGEAPARSTFCKACLGLSFHPERPRVRFNQQLSEYLARVQIRNLRLGDAVVDLSLERHQRDVGVNVLNKAGEVGVSVVL